MSGDKSKTPRFAGLGAKRGRAIGGHHSAKSKTEEWYTPPDIIERLGGWASFDLDPCAPEKQPYPTARNVFTKKDNGLLQRWIGRVLLNPPYSTAMIAKFMARMADHGHGTALIFARTETETFFRYVWEQASGLLFIRGRLNFHVGDPDKVERAEGKPPYQRGERADFNSGAPTVLCAYGMTDLDILAGCNIDGQFVPLRFSRSVLVGIPEEAKTWRQIVDEFAAGRDGPFPLDEIYRYVRALPKCRSNKNPEAKVRQILQRGPYRPAQRGLWERAQE